MKVVKKMWPLLVIIVVMLTTYFLGLWDYLSFEHLKENKLKLEQFLRQYPILTPALYLLLYVITTMLSIPIGFILTLIGGFLWPQPWSTFLVVVGATIGASILFLAASSECNPDGIPLQNIIHKHSIFFEKESKSVPPVLQTVFEKEGIDLYFNASQQ